MTASLARPATVPAGKVFLVDDEPSVRRALTRLLRVAGLEVASFASVWLLAVPCLPVLVEMSDIRRPFLFASPRFLKLLYSVIGVALRLP